MSKLIAALVASMFAAAAFAQTGGVPPTQPPTGTKMTKQEDAMMKHGDKMKDEKMSEKKEKRAEKRHDRKMKRAAKVGDKPVQ